MILYLRVLGILIYSEYPDIYIHVGYVYGLCVCLNLVGNLICQVFVYRFLDWWLVRNGKEISDQDIYVTLTRIFKYFIA